MQNIGGIGNVTWLPPGAQRRDVLAFDTGPGNMVLDALAEAATDGDQRFDADGRLAAAGHVHDDVLERWLADPYFERQPPKTTGREQYGVQFARAARGAHPELSWEDLLATATALTAESIARGYQRFVAPRGPIDEVIVGGGGARNPTLMGMLRERLEGIPVVCHEERGIDSDAKEALAIAVLANDALLGLETNLTGATGGRGTVLGKINL